jgi:hypothetical protein
MEFRWLHRREPNCLRSNGQYAARARRSIAWFCGATAYLIVAPALSQNLIDGQIRLQQEMLIWTTDYEGLIDGKVGPETIKAINRFQSRIGHPATGNLTQEETKALVKLGSSKRDRAGFKQIVDNDAGVTVGIPKNLVSASTRTKWGNQWYGKAAGLAIDTLRFGGDVSLDQLFDRLRSINNRKVAYERKVSNEWFVIAAYENDAAVYVRADTVVLPNQQSEIRGFSIWMSKDRPPDYEALPSAMLSSFSSNHSAAPPSITTTGSGNSSNPTLYPTPRLNPLPTEPIATVRPASSIGECYRGLGDCPTMLTFR